MTNEKNIDVKSSEVNEVKEKSSEDIVKFAKPHVFEGETYKELDLSGCEKLTAKDLIEANNYLARIGRNIVAIPNLDLQYLLYVAHLGTGKPIEFFETLSMANATKVKNKVQTFFSDDE